MKIAGVKKYRRALTIFFVCALAMLFIPSVFVGYVQLQEKYNPSFDAEFPVTVDPHTKTILSDERVEAYLQSDASPLQANASAAFSKIAELVVSFLASFSNRAADTNLVFTHRDKVVVIAPGARKEEVAAAFAGVLGWSAQEKKEFLSIPEGFLFPGTYAVHRGASPLEVLSALYGQFEENVASRYGESVEEVVPLATALTIASLIQKETIGTRDMRLVSGIIWNRIFAGQKLQLDATLQYAKASRVQNGVWWPRVLPKDKFIDSPYNTYKHAGLPPTPIASPSTAAVVAALNPSQTDCFFYFHDPRGDIHCSADYETHAALIDQLFSGQ